MMFPVKLIVILGSLGKMATCTRVLVTSVASVTIVSATWRLFGVLANALNPSFPYKAPDRTDLAPPGVETVIAIGVTVATSG